MVDSQPRGAALIVEPSGPPPGLTATRPVLVAGAIMVAGATAWLLFALAAERAVSRRLPQVPDLSHLPAAVAKAITAADAHARVRATPARIGNLGIVYQANLRPDEALSAFALAESLDPADWLWPYHRGLILLERGDQRGAEAAFRLITESSPARGLAQFHLAKIAVTAGRQADAETAYLAAQSAPVLPSVDAAFRPARKSIPLAAHASLGLSRLLLERGEVDAARARLNSLVAAYPEFASAQSLLSRLEAQGASVAIGDGGEYVPPADPWLEAVVTRSLYPEVLLKHAAFAARAGDTAWQQWLVRRAVEVGARK